MNKIIPFGKYPSKINLLPGSKINPYRMFTRFYGKDYVLILAAGFNLSCESSPDDDKVDVLFFEHKLRSFGSIVQGHLFFRKKYICVLWVE